MIDSPRDESPTDAGEPDPADRATSGGLSRRAALQGLAGSIGTAFAAPAVAGADVHPISQHVAKRPRRRGVDANPVAAPQVLDAHQSSTLAVVADLIVPGAVASGSPAFIDHVLAVESPDVRRRFVSALGALDAAARDQHRQSFAALARAQQIAILGASAHAEAVDHLKGWIAGAHYSSEAGMKELGWTGVVMFPAFHGCTHPDGHQ